MLAAILFDLDGTVAHTDPIHFQVWLQLLLDYGLEIDEAFYKRRISGGRNWKILENILPQLAPEERQRLAEEKEARFRRQATNLKPLPGLSKLLQWTEARGLKRALVTNAPRQNVDFILSTLGLERTFAPVVLAENVPAPKPDPAIYNQALASLGIESEQAIAFEDSPAGIKAAVGAGIYTIGMTTNQEPTVLKDLGAAMAIADFTHPALWELLDS